MLLAAMNRLPTVIFEPNAEPGFSNRLLAMFATRMGTGYPSVAESWGARAKFTGCPVRPEFFNVPPRHPAPPFHVLITGGSQGALPINRVFVDAMDQLAARKDELSVVHQTGERDFNAVRTAYARREFRAEVVPFLSNMAERFAWADLIVCRAGAITAAEVAASGRAAIFIPFGRATDSHQLRNAQEMSKAGAGKLIIEPELTADRLTNDIFSLVDRPEEIEQIGGADLIAIPAIGARTIDEVERDLRRRPVGRPLGLHTPYFFPEKPGKDHERKCWSPHQPA
jgi:UDP-N-acetylglucosamine--N-acetylmuramyl-(pentapeptide) pyrophosphoryl-undecaprenol N-acetylglucosamine transferase